MQNHWALSWAVKHWHKLVNCSINAKPLGTILSYQTPKQLVICSINAKPLGTILSYQTPTQLVNCSINAKPLGMISETINAKLRALSQLFNHCQTNGQDLINLYARWGTITSHTVIKAESIPTNMYLDIYVTDYV